MWLGAGHTRGHGALDLFGLFERYTGTLVSDDYNGYAKYQAILTARQLCNAHLIRSATGVVEAEPRLQSWATTMIEVLRAGRKAVKDATAAGRTSLNSQEIEQIRESYREQAAIGITANRGVGKTAVTRYTRLRCPRSGAVLRAGWGSSAESRDVVDRARQVLIRTRRVCGGWRPPYLRESRTPGARVLDDDELIRNWTLVGDDLEQLSGRRGSTKVGFALLLRFYAVHGRFPAGRGEIPDQAVAHVARLVDVSPGCRGL